MKNLNKIMSCDTNIALSLQVIEMKAFFLLDNYVQLSNYIVKN